MSVTPHEEDTLMMCTLKDLHLGLETALGNLSESWRGYLPHLLSDI